MTSNARTFRAPSTREALALVKSALGPDAVILQTRTLAGDDPMRRCVAITAAGPGSASAESPASGRGPRPARANTAQSGFTVGAQSPPAVSSATSPPVKESSGASVPTYLYPYYVELVQAEVAEELAATLLQDAARRLPRGDHPDRALRAALRAYIAHTLPEAGGVKLNAGCTRRVALVGPSGSGKTTTLAKLAAHFKLRQGRSVALLSLDSHRIGGPDQLRRYADVLDVPLHTAQHISEVKDALRATADVDLLLIDTVGLGPREQGKFARLAALLRAARPDEQHLVLPATLLPSVQARTAESFAPLGIDRVVLTRLDDAVGLGVILNAVKRLNLRLSYLTHGDSVPDDIEEACGRRVAELLLLSDDSRP